MKTDLFCYTGTGNSLWIARELAKGLGDTRIYPMPRVPGEDIENGADAVGIIFPVHIWGLPHPVIAALDSLARNTARYHFAVAVNAGQVAATLLQLKRLMEAKGLSLSSGFEIAMPSNYIPWGGPGPEEKRREKFESAREKVGQIAAAVVRREGRPVEKGPLWQNILLSWLYKLSFSRVPRMDKDFWVDGKCNACAVCASICRCGNITLEAAGKPVWLHRCEQCLACIQWCPQEAIQFGKKTPRYERYHHPEVTLRDMMAGREGTTGETGREHEPE